MPAKANANPNANPNANQNADVHKHEREALAEAQLTDVGLPSTLTSELSDLIQSTTDDYLLLKLGGPPLTRVLGKPT